jgi:hypothetical protein
VAKRLLRREHIVAASLVGSVVVVIGFASGLGTRPGTGANAAPAPGGDEHPVATAPAPTTQAQPTQNTGGGGTRYTGGSPGGGGGGIPVTTAPALPPGTDHTTHPTTPPATTTTPPGSTDPNAPCQPGLVPAALDTLLATLGSATDALGLGIVPTTAIATATLLPQLPAGTPLDQFVATCPAPATTAPTTTTTTGHG